jgi:hypothetical protein
VLLKGPCGLRAGGVGVARRAIRRIEPIGSHRLLSRRAGAGPTVSARVCARRLATPRACYIAMSETAGKGAAAFLRDGGAKEIYDLHSGIFSIAA